jgi:hypothetical protein
MMGSRAGIGYSRHRPKARREGDMSDVQFVLSREQRDEISRAVAAIGRRVKEMPNTQADLFVIWTNLAIIQTNLTNLPRVSSN